MLLVHDPDQHETVTERHVCPFHKMHPGESYAGCTCSSSVRLVSRPLQEVMRTKADRERAEEDRILREAEIIRARRAAQNPN